MSNSATQLVERVADAFLDRFVPKADVSAGCPPDPYYKYCFCDAKVEYWRYVYTRPDCSISYGSCGFYKYC
ncbi:hypothetical protein [Kribbella catacumbae]|uniref:hypothetical protein n=1 Tax=Kribbella catacumbae TaxID=460086 RepID=UPI00037E692B|nr:hypothetical protein [Kribbella catacumbae]